MRVWSLGWEDSLEEGTATHSSSLACRIPWTERPGGLQPIRSQRVSHGWSDLAHTHTFLLPQTFYAVEIPGGSGTNRYFKLNHFSPRSQFKPSSFHLRKTKEFCDISLLLLLPINLFFTQLSKGSFRNIYQMTSLSCSSRLPCSWDEDKIDHCHLQRLNYANPASLSSLSLDHSPLTQHDLLSAPDGAKWGCTSANTSGTGRNKGDIGLDAPEEASLTGA